MTELRFSWEKPLLEVQSENDLQKLASKVEVAETAIFLRLSELANSPDGQQELEALQRAARELLIIKHEKLRWPRVNLGGPSAANGEGGIL
jgi:hypothetical protein